jgi:RHS repeat-associated protein
VVDVNSGNSVTGYKYDRVGRVTEVNDINRHLVKYEYDARGLRTKLTYPDDSNVTYEYDSLGRLTKLNYNGSMVAQYRYDELSRRIETIYGNETDANTAYYYDIGNRLTRLAHRFNSTQKQVFEYTSYDKVGNRKNMIMDSNESKYYYDNRYQLTGVDYPSAWKYGIWDNPPDANFLYDNLGNRMAVQSNGSTIPYTHNELNQYILRGTTESFGYDLNGNLHSDVDNVYYYDSENHLMDVEYTDYGDIVYDYDYAGRRIVKVLEGDTTRYVYDGDNIIAEYYDGECVAKYVHGPNIDEPVCMIAGSDQPRYYYHQDGLGSVTALSDNCGYIAERYRYEVFGGPTIIAPNGQQLWYSAYDNPFMFAGMQFDDESWLYYCRARSYSPDIGRFLQPDPIGYNGGINLYTYVGNNPVNFTDPEGKWLQAAACVLCGIMIGKDAYFCYREAQDAPCDKGKVFLKCMAKSFIPNDLENIIKDTACGICFLGHFPFPRIVMPPAPIPVPAAI